MPVGISSPARNLFLLGSTGEQTVTNFFKAVDLSASTDGVFLSESLKYRYDDDSYTIAGSASDPQSKGIGWIENRTYNPDTAASTQVWDSRIESTTGQNVLLRSMIFDQAGNIIAVGHGGGTSWIQKYSSAGVLDWQATTFTGNVRYRDVAHDGTSYYVCGHTGPGDDDAATAYVEKYDSQGNPLWGKGTLFEGDDVILKSIAVADDGNILAVGRIDDNDGQKGFMVKLNSQTGDILWDKTIVSPKSFNQFLTLSESVGLEKIYADGNGQFYVVGKIQSLRSGTLAFRGTLIKFDTEGNIIWQRETPLTSTKSIEFYDVSAETETEQVIVLGRYYDGTANDEMGMLSKYTKNGTLLWRRILKSSRESSDTFSTTTNPPSLDADNSFYYVLFHDETTNTLSGEPDRYTFGKVSTSGNGLGDFEYADSTGETIDYQIVNIDSEVGVLQDGSVTNSVSDLRSTPYSATKIVFDDYATNIAGKKRQISDKDLFSYSGSPAIRPADFQELNLLGDVYSGSGDWLDQSGKGNDATTIFATEEPFSGAGSVSFDGDGDYLDLEANSDFAFGTGDFTIEGWLNTSSFAWNNGRNVRFYMTDGPTDNATGNLQLMLHTNGALYLYTSGSDLSVITNGIFTLNQWSHFAVCRSGTTLKSYVNGTEASSTTYSNSITANSGSPRPRIGSIDADAGELTGYISNLRVLKGTALYTSNFTPPSTSLTDITNTVLLTCQGTSIVDASSNGASITVNGNAAAPVDSVTHNAAGYWEFDGVNDYINVGDLGIDMSQFTVEVWFNPSVVQNYDNVLDCNYGTPDPADGVVRSGNIGPRLEMNTAGGLAWNWGASRSANDPFFTANVVSSGLPANTWHHTALVVDGNQATNGRTYYNGSLVTANGSQTVAGSISWYGEFQNVNLGRGFVLAGDRYLNGEIGEVRIYPRALTAAQVFQNYNSTKSKFINEAPDTAPNIGPGIVYGSDLLLNYDFGNRATYDRAQNLIPNGNQIGGSGWSNPGSNSSNLTTTNPSPTGENLASTWDGPGYYEVISGTTDGTTYMMSVYAKQKDAGTDGFASLQFGSDTSLFGGGSDRADASFNLATGTVTSTQPGVVSAGIEDVGNGWYRCYVSGVKSGTGDIAVIVYCGNHGNGASLYAWGAQLEESSTLGRHIRTYGSAITAPTTVNNLSSSSYTGTLNGATLFNSAGYFDFDGTDDYISLGTSNFLTGVSDFTLEMWLYPDNLTIGNYYTFFSYGGYVSSGWLFQRKGDGLNTFRFAFNGNDLYDTGTEFSTTGEWKHIVVIVSGGVPQNVYVDSVSQSISGSGTLSITTDQIVEIGRRKDTVNQYFDGRFGEVRIYSRALSATEVSQNFNVARAKYGV